MKRLKFEKNQTIRSGAQRRIRTTGRMMDYQDLKSAVTDGMSEVLAEQPRAVRLMRIDPFKAFDADGKQVDVVGGVSQRRRSRIRHDQNRRGR